MDEDRDAPNWREINELFDTARYGKVLLETSSDQFVESFERYRGQNDFSNPYEELMESLFTEYTEMDEVWNGISTLGTLEAITLAVGINNKGKAEGYDIYYKNGFKGPLDLKSTISTLETYLEGLYNLYSDRGSAEKRIEEDKEEMIEVADDVAGFMFDLEPLFVDDE